MKRYHLISFLKGQYSLKDVIDYFRGNIRYVIYYRAPFLMRPHIREQVDFRVAMMDRECYNNGSCRICGCATIHLQMANKSCEGNCYPKMMSKQQWKKFKYYGTFVDGKWLWVNKRRNLNSSHLKSYVFKMDKSVMYE